MGNVHVWCGSGVHDADDELGPFLDHEPWKGGEIPEWIVPDLAALPGVGGVLGDHLPRM